MYSVHCFFKDTNRPEQEYIFVFSKTVSLFAYLEELALKVEVLPSELEADTDEPE